MNNNHWCELYGIRIVVRHYQNGYIVTRSDWPNRAFMDNGKPFPTRESAKKALVDVRGQIYEQYRYQLLREQNGLI